MILRNLRFTFRNFRNQKLFTVINLSGLTNGIVSASLILIYISYELSFDRFNKNSGRIFRIYSTYKFEGAKVTAAVGPTPLASFLRDKIPEIVKTVRIAHIPRGLVSYSDKSFFENEIMTMLNREFIKWVLFAFIIATPVALFSMHKCQKFFAYKTELSWWIFAISGLIALAIALLTVSWQSWRAATRNPVEALRYE